MTQEDEDDSLDREDMREVVRCLRAELIAVKSQVHYLKETMQLIKQPTSWSDTSIGTNTEEPTTSPLETVLASGNHQMIYDYVIATWPKIGSTIRGLASNLPGNMRAALTAGLSRDLDIDPQHFSTVVEAIARVMINSSAKLSYGPSAEVRTANVIHSSRVAAADGLHRVTLRERMHNTIGPKLETLWREHSREIIICGGIVTAFTGMAVVSAVDRQIMSSKTAVKIVINNIKRSVSETSPASMVASLKAFADMGKAPIESAFAPVWAMKAAAGSALVGMSRHAILSTASAIAACAPSGN